MKSAERGTTTSVVELANMSPHGMWLLIDDEELYLSFESFPWFRDATIGQLSRVERPSSRHLYWPELDVDLTLDNIRRPEDDPMVSGKPSPER